MQGRQRWDTIGPMDWESILPIIMALLFSLGLPFALLARRKATKQPVQDLLTHLQAVGVKARLAETADDRRPLQPKLSWGEKLQGIIAVENRNFDYIAATSTSSQYGTYHYINYLVPNPGMTVRADRKKTSTVRKKSPPLWGRVVDIVWKGDPHLSQRLNLDYSLKYKLLHEGLPTLKGDIQILPESKHSHTRIKTNYELPSAELLHSIDIVSKHVRSWT